MNSVRMAAGLEEADVDLEAIDPIDGWEFVDDGPLMAPQGQAGQARKLRWCPACRYVFDAHEHPSDHLCIHSPADFGLGR